MPGTVAADRVSPGAPRVRRGRRCALWLFATGAIAFALLTAGMAGEERSRRPAREYEVKAAILYNIGRFVQWPAAPEKAIDVCVLGEDPFGDALEAAMLGKRLGTRPIVIRRYTDPDDIHGCSILFISASEKRRLPQILRVADAATLTVGDFPEFALRGGMVNLVTAGTSVHFEVNLAAVNRSGLRISSQLLALARIVDSKREARE